MTKFIWCRHAKPEIPILPAYLYGTSAHPGTMLFKVVSICRYVAIIYYLPKLILMNGHSMLCVGQLSGGHDSTVVAIQFSPNNKYIASAGKDRTLCIHSYDALTGSDACPYATVICHKSAHKRIIWDLR